MYLNEIATSIYSTFIKDQFENHKKTITIDAIEFILTFSHRHTYYTQALCNKVFAMGLKKITLLDVQKAASVIIYENEAIYFQYRSLLTTNQWQLLKAIAHADKVYQPSSKKFIQQYQLGTPANVQRSLEALLNKEMIFSKKDSAGQYYRVYDCFLLRWLALK
jgi:hypothetical protein